MVGRARGSNRWVQIRPIHPIASVLVVVDVVVFPRTQFAPFLRSNWVFQLEVYLFFAVTQTICSLSESTVCYWLTQLVVCVGFFLTFL